MTTQGGGSGANTDGTVQIQWAAPAPVITAPTDNATVNASPTISGTAVEGNTVSVFNGTALVCTTVAAVGDGGAWECVPEQPLVDGPATLTAQQTDTPESDLQRYPTSEPVSVTVDVTAPSAPTITAPADGAVLNDATPTFTGSGDDGDTITLTNDAGDTIGTGIVVNGSWSITPAGDLPEGDVTVTATATDPAGNETAGDTITVTIDVTAPSAPPSDVACVTNADGTVTCSGTGSEPGDSIIIRDGDGNEVCRVEVPVDLNWSCTTDETVTSFPLTITEADPAGNESSAVTTPVPAEITSPTDGTVTNDTTPTFTGTGTAGDTVRLLDASGTVICETEVGGDGTWSCTPTAPLPEGTSRITPVTVAADGSALAGTAIAVTVDTTPPAAAGNVQCTQNQDGTVTCTGTAEPGSTVTITSSDGTELCTVEVIAPGQWSCTTTTPVDSGSVVVTVTDPAGNSSSITVSVDPNTPSTPGGDGSQPITPNTNPGGGELAFTGADLSGAALAALLLLTAGVVLRWRSRRHRARA